MIILKFTKDQGLTLSLKDIFFEKRQVGGRVVGGQIDPPAILGLMLKTNDLEKNEKAEKLWSENGIFEYKIGDFNISKMIFQKML